MQTMEFVEEGAFTFIWKIENFNHCLQTRIPYPCVSSPFNIDSSLQSWWNIRIYRSEPVLCLQLVYLDDCPITVVYQLSLMNINGALLNSVKEKKTFRKFEEHGTLPHPNIKYIYEKKRSAYLPQDTLTVFCRLWRADISTCDDVQCFARTRIGVKRVSRVWGLDNFYGLVLKHNRRTIVSFAEISVLKMVIEIFSDGIPEEPFKILIHGEEHTDHSLMCKVSVLDRFGKPFKEMLDEHTFSESQLTWIFPKFISFKELYAKKNDLFPEGTLYLRLEFTLSIGVDYKQIESTHYGLFRNQDSNKQLWNIATTSSLDMHRTAKNSESRSSLSMDMLSLYQEKTFSDLNLTVEDVTFPVHKLILCARSPVFKSMMTSNMKEGNSNLISVTDVDADTMGRMLQYVYTDFFDTMELESALKLYYAADKYGILSLKQKCSLALKSHLTVQNACVILSLADRHQDDELTSAVHVFILNHDEEILKSTEWTEFETENSQLATTTLCVLYKKKLKVV